MHADRVYGALRRFGLDPNEADEVAQEVFLRAWRGLGRFLTLFAEDEARGRGVRTLTLNTRPSNSAALALYEGLGYRAFKTGPRSWGEAVYLRKLLEAAR